MYTEYVYTGNAGTSITALYLEISSPDASTPAWTLPNDVATDYGAEDISFFPAGWYYATAPFPDLFETDGIATFWMMLPSDGSVVSEGDTVDVVSTNTLQAGDNAVDSVKLVDWFDSAMSGVATSCAALALAAAVSL